MTRTVLVTGGAGFIGSHLVEALLARGDRVRVVDNLVSGLQSNLDLFGARIEFFPGDVNDPQVLDKAMPGVELVFHEAALASVPLSIENPLATHAACGTGTLSVLDAARRHGVKRVIYAGSSSAYGNRDGGGRTEDETPAPLSPYAAGKLAGENYCLAFHATYGLETVVLRYFNVFGPRQDPSSPYSAVIPKFVAAMKAGRAPTIFGDGGQSRDFTSIENVVQGNLLAAETPGIAGQVINIATGSEITLLDLVAALNRHLGTSFEPIHEAPRAGEVRQSCANIDKARRLLGYAPTVDFETGLKRLLAAEGMGAG